VYGTCEGSFAEYACAKEGRLALKPKNLSFEQAAAVPISAVTALQALRNAGRIQAGQEVLVIGAAGGVGAYAVQLAKAFGAQVTGVCSTAKTDLVRSIGADHVIDYTHDDFADGSRGRSSRRERSRSSAGKAAGGWPEALDVRWAPDCSPCLSASGSRASWPQNGRRTSGS
jgi:NADPH:quinone reductase-like Zn-dependent oxidoreductase